jgi:hypothetical protein
VALDAGIGADRRAGSDAAEDRQAQAVVAAALRAASQAAWFGSTCRYPASSSLRTCLSAAQACRKPKASAICCSVGGMPSSAAWALM